MPTLGGYPVARGPGLNNAGHDGRWKHRFDIDTDPPGGVAVTTPMTQPGARWLIERSDYDAYGYGHWVEASKVGAASRKVVYAHLRRRFAVAGAVVPSGYLLGWTGNTGRSNSEHLHFECSWGTTATAWDVADSIWEVVTVLTDSDKGAIEAIVRREVKRQLEAESRQQTVQITRALTTGQVPAWFTKAGGKTLVEQLKKHAHKMLHHA